MLKKPPIETPEIFKGLSCERCPLYTQERNMDKAASAQKGWSFSVPHGDMRTGVLAIGEALGKKEGERGIGFQGQAGEQLRRTFSYAGYDSYKDFAYWNMIACKPPDNKLNNAPWEQMAIVKCEQYFRRVVDHYQPRVVLLLGEVPMRHLLGLSGIIHTSHPKRGYVYDVDLPSEKGFYRALAVPTMHPSYIMRGNQHLTYTHIEDFQKAVRVARDGEEKYSPLYIEHPDRDSLDYFKRQAQSAADSGAWLAADIETDYSVGKNEETDFLSLQDINITRISFSFREGFAITIPWQKQWLGDIQEILSMPFAQTVFWNADFDVPRLRDKGIKLRDNILDAMWMWHFLHSALPKGLAYVATFFTPLREWKSQGGARPQYYSCVDSDATAWIMYAVRKQLEQEGRYEAYRKHTHELLPILSRMSTSGIPIDSRARRGFYKKIRKIEKALNRRINELVPVEVKPRTYRKVLTCEIICPRCKGTGKDPDKSKLKKAGLTIKALKQTDYDNYERDLASNNDCRDCETTGTINRQIKAKDFDGTELQGFEPKGNRWERIDSFNANSQDDVFRYIKFRGHKIPTKYGKPTSDEDAMKTLIRQHPDDEVYPLVIKVRKYGKVRSTYIKGYVPDSDGKLRTKFTLNPCTLRLASEGPNVQNIRNRGDEDNIPMELVKQYREMFVAEPGYKLFEIDYRGIESLMVGYFANDPDYIRAAKLGIHGILASHILHRLGKMKEPISMEWTDSDILEAAREVKKNFKLEYNAAKVGGHASNYLATARKLYMIFPEYYPSLKFAQMVQDTYFSTLARKVREWQMRTLQRAHSKFYLQNDFGYRYYFWDVLSKGGRLGQQARDCIAALPQGTAAAIIKNAMWKLAQDPYYFEHMRWQIHDALLFMLPEENLERDAHYIASVMSAPLPEMNGLSVDVEAEYGDNWGEMKNFKLE